MTLELMTSSALLELMTPPRVPLGNRPPPLDACISDRDYQPSSHAPPPSSGVAGWPAERSRWSSRTPALTPRLGRRRHQCNLEVNLLEDARGPVAATTDRHVGRWRPIRRLYIGGGYPQRNHLGCKRGRRRSRTSLTVMPPPLSFAESESHGPWMGCPCPVVKSGGERGCASDAGQETPRSA